MMERIKKFDVVNPVKVGGSGGHIKYTVFGIDGEGEFQETRRFREFFALAQAIRVRWPGCYVPSIPEKKMVGNDKEEFVEERRSLLVRFLKQIAKNDYIINSKEFGIFARV